MKNVTLLAALLLVAHVAIGQTWNRLNTNFTDEVNNVHFANEQLGYVIGDGANMYKTTDGGNSWTALTPPVASNVSLRGLWASGTGVVYVSGSANTINGENATLLKSEDFGETWVEQNIGHTNGFENHITCLDVDHCILSGGQSGAGGMIAQTTTGGPNWNKTNHFGVAFFSQVTMVDANMGYAVGLDGNNFTDGVLYQTTDGGASWSYVNSISAYIQSIHCFTQYNCLCGTSTAMYRTNDSGQNWSLVQTPVSETILDIEFVDEANGYFVTVSGIYKTSDSGQSWEADASFSGSETMQTLQVLGHMGKAFAGGSDGAVYALSFTPNALEETMLQSARIWPNPASNQLRVELDGNASSAHITDLAGRTVQQFTTAELASQQLDISTLQAGTYLLTIETNGQLLTSKFVKR